MKGLPIGKPKDLDESANVFDVPCTYCGGPKCAVVRQMEPLDSICAKCISRNLNDLIDRLAKRRTDARRD
jgi:hypothetical protein